MQEAPIILMVSGGADSTFMTYEALETGLDLMDGEGIRRIDPERLTILHINHMIRPKTADQDEQFVRDLASKLDINSVVRSYDVPRIAAQDRKNLELAAREVRYKAADELLEQLCEAAGVDTDAGLICTAHTLDDRVETFLMRLIDGSSTTGLVSIRPVRGRIIRPLLSHTRRDIEAQLNRHGRPWCEDETNEDTTYLRAYVRNAIIPLMEERNPRFLKNMERTMFNLERDEDYLSAVAQEAYPQVTRYGDDGSLIMDAALLKTIHPAVRNRIIMQAISDTSTGDIRIEADHIKRVSCALEEGGALTLPGGLLFTSDPSEARLLPESLLDEEPFVSQTLSFGSQVDLGRAGVIFMGEKVAVGLDEDPLELARTLRTSGVVNGEPVSYVEIIDAETVSQLNVIPAKPGMRFQPIGMKGRSRLISDLLMEAGVPRYSRQHAPVIMDEDGGCVWVVPFRLSESVRVGKSSEVLVSLGFSFSENG